MDYSLDRPSLVLPDRFFRFSLWWKKAVWQCRDLGLDCKRPEH